jgi:hypothetical protein
VSELENWRYYQFVAECFFPPDVLERSNEKDPQFVQLREVIEDFQKNVADSSTPRPLHLLDYGAGKCRIWDCLKFSYDKDVLDAKIIYDAYEPYPPKDFVYDKGIAKVFDAPTVLSAYRNGDYDIVILMNVLHEIPVLEWEGTLDRIHDLLNDQGVVVFIEVSSLSKGEQPNGKNGFIVLNDVVVQKHFNPKPHIHTHNDKSNVWIIKKEDIRLSHNEIIECIKDLHKATLSLLKSDYEKKLKVADDIARGIANGNSDEKDLLARSYAFHSQQYINTMFAIDKLVDRPSAGGFTEESIKGKAAITKITGEQGAVIAGAELRKGEFSVNDKVHVHRGGTIIHTGNISQLERTGNFNDRLQIGIKNFSDLEVGDVIEAFTTSNA